MFAAAPLVPVFVEKIADAIDSRTGHYDSILTDMSYALMQETDGFVAGQIFNHVSTPHKSGSFVKYPPGYQLRHGFRERGDNTPSQKVTWGAGFDGTYMTKVYAAHMAIGRQLQANVTGPINPEMDTLDVMNEHALIFKDEKWCEAYFKAGVWAVDLAGVTFASGPDPDTEFVFWDDYINSDPVLDVATQRDMFRQRTGKEISKIVLGRFVYTKLIHHPKVLARVIGGFSLSGADPAKANLRTLASLFEVAAVVVAAGIHDTNNEGDDVDPRFIAGSHCLLVHSPPRTNLKAPMAGAHFCWTGYEAGVNNLGVVVDKWYERRYKSWIMEMELAFGLEVIAPALGVFFENAISA